MKNQYFALMVSLILGQTAQAAQTVTSADLVAQLLSVIENVKGLDSTCALSLTASTSAEEFVAVTLKDERSGETATLKLKSSSGRIAKSTSGNSGIVTQTFKTSKGQLSLSSYEDLADLSVDLEYDGAKVSCKFSE